MSASVIIVVDLDATAAPPASDSLRQLLALIEGLSTDGGSLDWRLMSLTLNSPLKAELRAFAPNGEDVSDARAADAAHRGLEVLGAVNDNLHDADGVLATMLSSDRDRLKALLQPLKGRAGRVSVSVPGRFDYSIAGDAARAALEQIVKLEHGPIPPAPQLGAVEGRIRAVTTHYNRPAIRLARDLTDELVLCVFVDAAATKEFGAEHTLAEVWSGRRVVVSGDLIFSRDAQLTRVDATTMRGLHDGDDVLRLLREAHQRGETAAELVPWSDDG